jgi:formiminoglutamase
MSGPLHADPHWPRAHLWLAGEHAPEAARSLAVLGAPSCLGSITPGRCDLAPAAVRRALERYSTYYVANGRDLSQIAAHDHGDLPIAPQSPAQSFDVLRQAVGKCAHGVDALVLLGGDNSITRAGVHGLGAPLNECGLLTLDAHFDLRHLDAGLTNGNPVRALLADGLPGENIVQIGIQSFANSADYARVARDAGIHVITAQEAHRRSLAGVVAEQLAILSTRVEAIYVDCDLDVLDRSFSPATPGSRPGGFAPWELRDAVRAAAECPRVKILDLVEMDPERDVADATALAAAACLLEFASGVAGRT